MSGPDDLIAGRYRLVRRVGSGAMGVVWEAWDDRLHRTVAVKLLHVQPGLSDADAELATLRAMREARITARLDHPNAVPVFDVVQHEGRPCLIMRFLPSSPLSVVLKERGALSMLDSARIVGQVASALAAAHRAGIVHRDVKPGNILIADDGTARISDFGISHALGDATLTSTGMVHGTPAYMAPEVARGEESSAAADVFALGATLYAMLEGAPPFGSDPNSIALLHRVAAGQFSRPRHGGAVTPLLLQMLATDPADRPTMDQVADYLNRVANPTADATPTVTLPAPAPDQAHPEPVVSQPEPTAVMAPVSAPPASWPSRSAEPPVEGRVRRPVRATWVVLALVAVLVAATALVLPRLIGRQGETANPAPAVSDTQAPAPSASAATSRAPSASASPSQSTSTAARPSPSASPTPSATTPTRTPSATPSSESGVTADQLAGAITRYYALMPDKPNDGWSLLTPSFQQGQAGGRKSYKRFWGSVDQVSVSGVKGVLPDKVQATIRYVYDDGRVVTDRTDFRLVDDAGTLKIDGTDVVSSTTS